MTVRAVMILLFLALGVVFACGKGRWLIAGYNTMSERERARYDEKKLMRIMRNGMFAFAGCQLLSLMGSLLGYRLLEYAGYGLFAAAAVVLIIRANTGALK